MRRLALLAVASLAACVQILGDDFEIEDEGGTKGAGATGVGAGGPGGDGPGGDGPGGAGPGGAGPGGGGAGAFGPVWSQRFGGSSNQHATDVAVADTGVVAITGAYNGQMTLGTEMVTGASSAWDGFIGKLDAQGTPQWLVGITSANGTVNPQAIAVDAAGAFYVGGFFSGSTDFGDGPWSSAGGADAFLLKRDANGGHVWKLGFNGPNNDYLVDLDVGPAGVVIAGDFQQSIDLGGGAMTSPAAAPIFVGAFSLGAQILASRNFGTQGSAHVAAVALDGAGHVYVTGVFDYILGFDNHTLNAVQGNPTVFLAKLTFPNLDVVWAQAFGSATGDLSVAAVAADEGGVAMTGWFEAPVDFGGGPLAYSGGLDAFVARFGPNGAHVASRAFGGAANQAGAAIALRPGGGVTLLGRFTGTLATEAGDLTAFNSLPDAFFLAIAQSGEVEFARAFGGDQEELFPALAPTPDGGVVLTVSTAGDIDYGAGNLPHDGTLDLTVAKLR